jgi:hypothetical protein
MCIVKSPHKLSVASSGFQCKTEEICKCRWFNTVVIDLGSLKLNTKWRKPINRRIFNAGFTVLFSLYTVFHIICEKNEQWETSEYHIEVSAVLRRWWGWWLKYSVTWSPGETEKSTSRLISHLAFLCCLFDVRQTHPVMILTPVGRTYGH